MSNVTREIKKGYLWEINELKEAAWADLLGKKAFQAKRELVTSQRDKKEHGPFEDLL